MTAIRLARGYTGRDLLVKFAGHYHGHSDSLLAEAGSGLATLSLPGSAGITAETAAQTLVLPYNDLDAVREAFDEHSERIAARDRRGRRRQHGRHGARSRVQPRPVGDHPPQRRPADRRRGADRVPRRQRRLVGPRGRDGSCPTVPAGSPTSSRSARSSAGACRSQPSAAGPRSWTSSRRSAPSTRPARSAATRWPSPRASRLSASPTPASTVGSTRSPTSSSRETSAALSAEGVEHSVQHAGNLFSFSFTLVGAAQLRRRPGAAGLALPAVLPLDARLGRQPAAVGVRGVVRHGGARRRGDLAHRRRAACCGSRRRGGCRARVARPRSPAAAAGPGGPPAPPPPSHPRARRRPSPSAQTLVAGHRAMPRHCASAVLEGLAGAPFLHRARSLHRCPQIAIVARRRHEHRPQSSTCLPSHRPCPSGPPNSRRAA